MKKENKFAEQFESWADTVSEGTWAVPDSDDEVAKLIDLLDQPLPVGVDGQNATNALYNIIGDDRLFDRLGELADSDPEADARDLVVDWLQDNLPHIYQQIMNEIGDPDYPAEPAEQPEVDEGNTYGSSNSGIDGVVYEEQDIEDNEQVCVYCGEPRDDKMGCCEENHFITKKEYDQDNVNEDEQDDDGGVEAIMSAIIRRIANSHHELLMKLGPDGVLEAAREQAEYAAPVDEIGTSDVSGWVRRIEQDAGIEKEEINPLEEAFEKLLNEAAINVGDTIRDKTQPEISGKVVGDMEENYTIQVDDDIYHIKKLNAEKVAKEAIEMPDNPDYKPYDKPTFQRKGITPGQPTGTLPGIDNKKTPGWVGYNTAEPAYKRKADYEQEREQLKKLAGVK